MWVWLQGSAVARSAAATTRRKVGYWLLCRSPTKGSAWQADVKPSDRTATFEVTAREHPGQPSLVRERVPAGHASDLPPEDAMYLKTKTGPDPLKRL